MRKGEYLQVAFCVRAVKGVGVDLERQIATQFGVHLVFIMAHRQLRKLLRRRNYLHKCLDVHLNKDDRVR